MTIFGDLGGNGKGVELSGQRVVIIGRNNAKKRFPSAVTIPAPTVPPPPPPPPPGVYYYAPILTGGL